MSYLESDFQSDFSAWIRKTKYSFTTAFELKVCKDNKPLGFESSFQPQQLPKLFQAKHGCVYKKLSDMDPSLKPFDCLQICNARAYVVVLWYAPREPKIMYWIDIDTFLKEKDSSNRKSLTKQRASEICEYQGNVEEC